MKKILTIFVIFLLVFGLLIGTQNLQEGEDLPADSVNRPEQPEIEQIFFEKVNINAITDPTVYPGEISYYDPGLLTWSEGDFDIVGPDPEGMVDEYTVQMYDEGAICFSGSFEGFDDTPQYIISAPFGSITLKEGYCYFFYVLRYGEGWSRLDFESDNYTIGFSTSSTSVLPVTSTAQVETRTVDLYPTAGLVDGTGMTFFADEEVAVIAIAFPEGAVTFEDVEEPATVAWFDPDAVDMDYVVANNLFVTKPRTVYRGDQPCVWAVDPYDTDFDFASWANTGDYTVIVDVTDELICMKHIGLVNTTSRLKTDIALGGFVARPGYVYFAYVNCYDGFHRAVMDCSNPFCVSFCDGAYDGDFYDFTHGYQSLTKKEVMLCLASGFGLNGEQDWSMYDDTFSIYVVEIPVEEVIWN